MRRQPGPAHAPRKLNQAVSDLEAEGFDVEDLEYRDLWEAALNRRAPGTFTINNRWYYDPPAIPRIGRALGLRYRTDAKPKAAQNAEVTT